MLFFSWSKSAIFQPLEGHVSGREIKIASDGGRCCAGDPVFSEFWGLWAVRWGSPKKGEERKPVSHPNLYHKWLVFSHFSHFCCGWRKKLVLKHWSSVIVLWGYSGTQGCRVKSTKKKCRTAKSDSDIVVNRKGRNNQFSSKIRSNWWLSPIRSLYFQDIPIESPWIHWQHLWITIFSTSEGSFSGPIHIPKFSRVEFHTPIDL